MTEPQSLQVLILGADAAEAERLVRQLEAAGFVVDWRLVSEPVEYRLRLSPHVDVVLCSDAVRGYPVDEAVRLARATLPDVPVIVTARSLDEERAAAYLEEGATDYVLSDRLARLGHAVRRALQERRILADREAALRALEQSTAHVRGILATITDVVWSLRADDRSLLYLSPAAERLTGHPIGAFQDEPSLWWGIVHPEDQAPFEAALEAAERWGVAEGEHRVLRADGSERRVTFRVWAAFDDAGRAARLEGIYTDVTDIRAIEAERAVANDVRRDRERLEELDKLKSHYIRMIAHELNNVVSPLTLYVDHLVMDDLDNLTPRQRRGFAAFERAAERLRRFLADLLDAARLQSGKLLIRAEPFDLARLVRQVVEHAQMRAEAVQVAVRVDAPSEYRVRGDPHRLEQVLENLIGNALKFTPSGGEVDVRLRAAHDGVRVEVSDTGPGVPEDKRDLLFEPFSRLTASRQGKHTGTGLGLFISRGIVEQHGGAISYERAGPEGGARFTVRLPPAAPSSLPEHAWSGASAE